MTWTDLLAALNGMIGRRLFVEARLNDGQAMTHLSGVLNLVQSSSDPRKPERDILFCSLTRQGDSGEEEYGDGEIIPASQTCVACDANRAWRQRRRARQLAAEHRG
jgi:hypothetical protein